MDRTGVLCVGSVVVDLAKVIDGYPEQERVAVIDSVTASTGGPALNLAVDLARLGAPFPLEIAGVVGDDVHGDFVLAALGGSGIGATRIRRAPGAATSFTDAMVVAGNGRRTFFHHIGANGLLDPAEVDLTDCTARILHMGAPGLHPLLDNDNGRGGNGWATVLAAARAAGMRTNLELVSIGPERIRTVAQPCLPHLDYLIVNELEACALAGVEAGSCVRPDGGGVDWSALERVAATIVGLGVGRLVAVHCPAGCLAVDATGRTWWQGSVLLPDREIRNATGAGDAFAAGVMFGLHEDWPAERCLEAGVCVAAASLRGAGTSDGVVPLAECLALGRGYGYRTHG